MSVGESFLWAWGFAAAAMLLVWIGQIKSSLAAIVDVAWAFLTGAVAAGLVMSQSVITERHILLSVMIGLWSLRLTAHLWQRLAREKNDGRYVYFREAMGRHHQIGMFAFFQVQAVWVILFAAPVWAASLTPRAGLDWLDGIGLCVFLTALIGEGIADRQLSAFKADPANAGRVCDVGLWRYSRHPNYFFEWVHWIAYVFVGWGSAWLWVAVAGVVIMYVFVTRVTGIPYTEKQAVRRRGDSYRQYQRTTSAFFPWPPKSTQEALS